MCRSTRRHPSGGSATSWGQRRRRDRGGRGKDVPGGRPRRAVPRPPAVVVERPGRRGARRRPLPRPRARSLCRGPRWPGNQESHWRRNGRSRTWRTSCTVGFDRHPEGGVISHRNSLAFVEWAAAAAGLSGRDRVCSPAPLHFDLSVFDIFATCQAAACLAVRPTEQHLPVSIARSLEANNTVWYSVHLGPHDARLLRQPAAVRPVVPDGDLRRGGVPPKHLARLMAELPPPATSTGMGRPRPTYARRSRCPGAGLSPAGPIGKACANTEAAPVTSEGGRVSGPARRVSCTCGVLR